MKFINSDIQNQIKQTQEKIHEKTNKISDLAWYLEVLEKISRDELLDEETRNAILSIIKKIIKKLNEFSE
ncbi:MAG: hypothetical protein I3273_06875 [Candidatus Moeniiplasma glomeromycotorum]|nr:hypothetical protein [Candidatus Moeniiplasma glomeromycotorum]MCE8168283.1 hypothetical protein [Candidatus Moeniiplasma glomeromycotorum]MCE8169809.1 hypothetical protein [Candidatus Moeniiplasma glomeromycotorum]